MLHPFAIRFGNRQTRLQMKALRQLRLGKSSAQRARAWKDFRAAFLFGYDTEDNRKMLDTVTYKRVNDRTHQTPQYCFCVKGTHWQVSDILAWAADGSSWRVTARRFPGMTKDQYEQVLCFAVTLAWLYDEMVLPTTPKRRKRRR